MLLTSQKVALHDRLTKSYGSFRLRGLAKADSYLEATRAGRRPSDAALVPMFRNARWVAWSKQFHEVSGRSYIAINFQVWHLT